jgi:adenine-specific DNA-methyltransferase
MTEPDNFQSVLAEIAHDVISKGNSRIAAEAFDAYRRCLEPLVEPYVGSGFLDEDKALPRFFSETATLHLAVSLIPEWCTVHNLGHAEGFWEIHPEARFFSWYKVPETLLSKIRSWAIDHSEIGDVLQAVALAAESSLAGLRRRSLGEFFTPTEIAQHLVALTDYDPLTIAEHKLVDPACGSGNLLAAVVAQTVQTTQSGSLDSTVVISSLNQNIYGFDIQPIAVLLTRLQLLLASLPLFEDSELSDANLYEALSFPCVQLRDPLSAPEDFWNLFASFDIALGNPPFLKVTKERLPFLLHYKEILAGQPNLYQLFLWWAIRATRAGGRVAFLVPQPIRAGQYLSKLRQRLAETCEMTAITCFVDRTGVFDSVDQQMMIVALKKPTTRSQRSDVSIRIIANGQSWEHLSVLDVDQDQVVWMQEDSPLWCVSNEMVDYAILTKVCKRQSILGKSKELEIRNGGFVWNQHKERLRPTESDNTLPLLSSASIGVHEFTFPPLDKRVSQRLFADATPPITEPIHRNRVILLKRTTPEKSRGRRIVAALLPENFLTKYPAYFVENHVNLIRAAQSSTPESYLLGLSAWLNSRLANFVFSMMNGSSHLSKFELQLMPAPILLLAELSAFTDTLLMSPTVKRHEILNQIDEYIFRFFSLSPEESQRVTQVVPLAT